MGYTLTYSYYFLQSIDTRAIFWSHKEHLQLIMLFLFIFLSYVCNVGNIYLIYVILGSYLSLKLTDIKGHQVLLIQAA